MSRGLLRLIVNRVLVIAGLLVLLSLVVFIGVDLLPGDPVTARYGPGAAPEVIDQARERLGLNRPLADRYLGWLGAAVTGNLGTSANGTPVTDLFAVRLGNSLLLAALTMVILVPASLLVGVMLGRRAGTRCDRTVSGALMLLVAIPEFVLAGVLVLVLAVGLGLFPPVSLVPAGDSPLSHPQVLVLPVLSLVCVTLAYASRLIRAATAAAYRAPHVEFLRLNGFAERGILRRAVLPAVLPVALQVWLIGGASLIGGAVLVERVFGYPGIGDVLIRAVLAGDLPVVQALALLFGALTLLAMLAADIGGLLQPGAARPGRTG